MGPKTVDGHSDQDPFRTELVNLIGQWHELVKLAELIDCKRSMNRALPNEAMAE